MPHIVIEYSRNLHDNVMECKLTQEVHRIVTASGLFSPDAVKTRSMVFDDYALGGHNDSFVHITVAILSGRPVDARKALSEAVFAVARGLMTFADKISVDVREMETLSYKKN